MENEAKGEGPGGLPDVMRDAPSPRDAELRFERIHDAMKLAGVTPPWQADAAEQTLRKEGTPERPDTRTLRKEGTPERPGNNRNIRGPASAARTVLRLACQRAPYLSTLMVRDPTRLGRVADDPYLEREKPRAVMAEELAGALAGCPPGDGDELALRLRRYRADEMVRLGARELALGNPAEVGRELAHLADVCFDAAIAFHDRDLRARHGAPRYVDDDGVEHDAELAVIGMGKLGGQELNFSSDVDVIYVYTSDAGSAGSLTLHEYFTKLCKLVTAALGEVTAEDVVFRVDLRLRPEGTQGPIANSLPSTERYYESWGRPWERQAWLKARPCAGSMALGGEIMRTLRPFVYPRITSWNILGEVAELNRRIKTELDASGSLARGFDVKNGVGGIREVEFFVQALQLVHGAKNPYLSSRTTLVALDQLLFAGFIPESEHRALGQAYRYLRRAEHLLQLEGGRQTQRLPAGGEPLALFARRLGHPDVDDFLATLQGHTSEVARLFASLGADDSAGSTAITGLLSGTLGEAREQAILADLGFRDPEHAHHELLVARRKPLSPLGPQATGAAARLAPALVAEMASSPDPDQALGYVSDLISRRGSWSSIWRLFDDNPALMRLVISLFGTSSFLAKAFVADPELIDVLLDVGHGPPVRSAERLASELARELGELGPDEDEEAWNRLARFKNTQVLRIGLADVGGELDAQAVSGELSRLAEVCLSRAHELVWRAMLARHGVPREEATGQPATLAVVALGKLGSAELGYASDLDVIFVYSGDGESDGARSLDNVSFMSRVAQRLVSGLHAMHPGGRLYELDTRLRPSGSQGLLVSSLVAWQKYHEGEARLWERQSLIRLRPVAGDSALGDKVAAAAASFVYGRAPGQAGSQDRAAIAHSLTAMRDKIERELAGGAPASDLKAGRGGLIDIEFASQFVQLVHGHDHPELRTRSTVASLERVAALGLADPADCALLCDGYVFLRRLEHRMRIVHDRSVNVLPRDRHELDKLARRAGHEDGASLAAEYERWTVAVRAAYQRVLAG